MKQIGNRFSAPTGIAVDGYGNIFVADSGAVQELPTGAGYDTNSTALCSGCIPYHLAVDGSGNVFFVNGQSDVYEIPAAGGYSSVNLISSNFTSTFGVAVDASENLFVADANSGITEILATGGYATTYSLGAANNSPRSVALDGAGNVFFSSLTDGAVGKLNLSIPSTLYFPSTANGSTSAAQAVTVNNDGNATLGFTASGLTAPADFSKTAGGGTPPDCANSGSVIAGASCNLSIVFDPHTASSPLNENFTLTNNSLNIASATQQIALTGSVTGGTPTIVMSPDDGTLPAGTEGVAYSQTFTASGGTAPYTYLITSGAAPTPLTLSDGRRSVGIANSDRRL